MIIAMTLILIYFFFLFWMVTFPVVPLMSRVYISQLIKFARVLSYVDDCKSFDKCFTAKPLKQGYRYHKLRKAFSIFYRRHHELVSKFCVGLISLLHLGLSACQHRKHIRILTEFGSHN